MKFNYKLIKCISILWSLSTDAWSTPAVEFFSDPSEVSCTPYNVSKIYNKEFKVYYGTETDQVINLNINGEFISSNLKDAFDEAVNTWNTWLDFRLYSVMSPGEANLVLKINGKADSMSNEAVACLINHTSGECRKLKELNNISDDDFNGKGYIFLADNEFFKGFIPKAYKGYTAEGYVNNDEKTFIDVYFRRLLVHELGHILGFAHSGRKSAPQNSGNLRVVRLTEYKPSDSYFPPFIMEGLSFNYWEQYKFMYKNPIEYADLVTPNIMEQNSLKKIISSSRTSNNYKCSNYNANSAVIFLLD